MEFWGVEVKAGEPLKVQPDDEESYIHLSQVALGESKKEIGYESVSLFLTIDNKKLVIGHLSTENMRQLSFDLVFEKEVELSHNSKNSVFFCGYQTTPQYESVSEEDEEEEELVQLENSDKGIQLSDDKKAAAAVAAPAAAPKSNNAKLASASKQKSKPVQPVKDNKAENESDDSDDEESSDEDDDESDDEEGSEEGMSVDGDSDEDDSESEDEETPKKAGKSGNKRPNGSAMKTPVPAKKQKPATPQKSDGKKVAHTATPHPAKAAAKTKVDGAKAKPQTPKSGGKYSCSSCDRAFGSDTALASHSKAKHAAK